MDEHLIASAAGLFAASRARSRSRRVVAPILRRRTVEIWGEDLRCARADASGAHDAERSNEVWPAVAARTTMMLVAVAAARMFAA